MSLAKQFIFQEKCREELLKGIKIMYDLVSATLGPHGRTILIEKVAHTLEATKDGVTAANEVYSPNKWEDMGMQLVREASQKANSSAGDATTTAVVLSYNLCKNSLDAVKNRANVYQISRGMKKAADVAVAHLDSIKRTIEKEEDFKKVATISTQDEEIGAIIAKTFINAGLHGSIDIERQDEPGIKPEKTEGLSFDKGWGASSPFKMYMNDRRNKKAWNEDVPVLVVERKLDSESQIAPILEMLAEPQPSGLSEEGMKQALEERGGWGFGIRKLLVVSDDFTGSAIGTMVANNSVNPQTGFKYFHLMYSKAPSYGNHKIETMRDICAVTGATFISEDHGGRRVEYATLKDLGKAKKVIIEENKTVIIGYDDAKQKEEIKERIEFIKAQIKEMPADHLERKEWELRLATLTDGISVLKVGAESNNERNELRRRVEDGVRAVQSAREEGVTPGCGVGLLQCIPAIEKLRSQTENSDQKKGMDIVIAALHSVTLRLLEVAYVQDFSKSKTESFFSGFFEQSQKKDSSAKERRQLVENMKKNMALGIIPNCGYNFETDTLDDMEKIGVLDAKKAVRVALQGAVSVATTFLKIDGAMGEIKDEEELFGHLKHIFARN